MNNNTKQRSNNNPNKFNMRASTHSRFFEQRVVVDWGDIVGPARVLCAWIGGLVLKLVGSKGGFYRLAGEQARLIDDVTGTTPPYDQTLVLGPANPELFCNRMAADLGVAVAVVDVNDLGRVKVLASSQGCDEELLHRALRPNPAGNANERTPLVLVRPT